MRAPTSADRTAIAIALVSVALLFAGNFLFLRVVVQTLPPLLVQAVRFVVAGGVLYAVAIARTQYPRPTLVQWRRAALLGALLVAVGQGCICWAEQYIGAGLTMLVTCTIPIWVALLGALFFRENIPWLATAGIAIGFAGLMPIVIANGIGAAAVPGFLALLAGTIAWAIGSILASRTIVHADGLVATAMQLVCGGMMLAAVAFTDRGFGSLERIATGPLVDIIGLAYLTVAGGIVAYSVYLWLLRNAPPSVASTFTYLQAIIGVTLGALVLHEPVPTGVLFGGVAVIGGVACVVASRR